MINTKITALIAKYNQDMIAFRRDLHRHPELPFEEVRTTNCIAQELDKLGITYRRTEPTGIIADIKGNSAGKTILLRADIDALPVQELNQTIDYKSTTDGKMHACGHDAHTAMLLTAAKALNEVKDQLPGNVRLVFQPAEEIAHKIIMPRIPAKEIKIVRHCFFRSCKESNVPMLVINKYINIAATEADIPDLATISLGKKVQ